MLLSLSKLGSLISSFFPFVALRALVLVFGALLPGRLVLQSARGELPLLLLSSVVPVTHAVVSLLAWFVVPSSLVSAAIAISVVIAVPVGSPVVAGRALRRGASNAPLLIEEGIWRLGPVAFANINDAILDHVRCGRAEQALRKVAGLLSGGLLEGHECEASALP